MRRKKKEKKSDRCEYIRLILKNFIDLVIEENGKI